MEGYLEFDCLFSLCSQLPQSIMAALLFPALASLFMILAGVAVSQDESEEIVDDHDDHDVEDDLDNDADDLDDVDVGEDESEHLDTEDLEEQTKEEEISKVSFSVYCLVEECFQYGH